MQEFKRSFRLWEFQVSHGQLLLRSPKSESESQNLDIVFAGVEYIELPTKMETVTLTEPSAEERERAADALGKSVPVERVFIIESNERRFLVVAAAMVVEENDLDLFESSLERFRP